LCGEKKTEAQMDQDSLGLGERGKEGEGGGEREAGKAERKKRGGKKNKASLLPLDSETLKLNQKKLN
jgi:hypothetical protein